MLDAVEPRRDQLARVEQLEVRRARECVRVADLDHGLRARQRQPEVDFQRRRAVADIDLRLPARLFRIARDDRVGRIRGMLAVDVRPAVKMRGPGRWSAAIMRRSSTNLSSHCPGSRKAVTPWLSCRSASFGSFSMWKCRSIRPGTIVRPDEIEPLGIGWRRDRCRPDRHPNDPIVLNHDASLLDRRGTAAVNHAHVVEDQSTRRRRLGQCRRHDHRDQNQRPPRKELAHRHRL